jgi:uncharacterized protein (TIGR03437 family)
MKRIAAVIVCLLLFAAAASAQPRIGQNGIVNGASFVPAGLPNSAIAQGSIFSIFGQNMAAANRKVSDDGFPLKTTADNVTVNIAAGGQTYQAILLFVGPGQINAILPSAVPVGSATVTVTYNGQTSNSQSITVVRSNFGILARNQGGSGPGIVFNYYSGTDQPFNTIREAAYPGQVMILWGTGLGPVTFPETGPPVAGNLDTAVEIIVGGKKIAPQYKGRSSYAGLDQINFQLPADVPAGCYVPVMVKTGTGASAVVSNAVSIAIASAQGQRACQDPLSFGGASADGFASGGREGNILLSRIKSRMAGMEFNVDGATATFTKWESTDALVNSHGGFGVSTHGACVTFSYRGDSPVFADPIKATGLDAGNPLVLTLPGAGGTKTLNSAEKGAYSITPSGGLPDMAGWHSAGNYTINVPGGADVQRFTATLTVPTPLVWTNMDAITTINRANGLPLTWSGGDPTDYVLISGYSDINNLGAGFYCLVRNTTQQFTVPSEVLSVLPPTGANAETDLGALSIGNYATADKPGVKITPTPEGLTTATFMYLFYTFKDVKYQ